MGELTHKDKEELNRKGRAAGLGRDLWPEVETTGRRETYDEALRRMSRHFNVEFEREVLRHQAMSEEGMRWTQEMQTRGMQGASPYFVHVDPATGGDFTSTLPWPIGSPAQQLMAARPNPASWVAEAEADCRADVAWAGHPFTFPRLKALFRRISPWAR